MPPGLYEIVITPKPGAAARSEDEAADFDLAIEERTSTTFARWVATRSRRARVRCVARVSDLNNTLYQTFLQPWIKMVSGPQVAAAVLELNPLRLGYSLPSTGIE